MRRLRRRVTRNAWGEVIYGPVHIVNPTYDRLSLCGVRIYAWSFRDVGESAEHRWCNKCVRHEVAGTSESWRKR